MSWAILVVVHCTTPCGHVYNTANDSKLQLANQKHCLVSWYILRYQVTDLILPYLWPDLPHPVLPWVFCIKSLSTSLLVWPSSIDMPQKHTEKVRVGIIIIVLFQCALTAYISGNFGRAVIVFWHDTVKPKYPWQRIK